MLISLGQPYNNKTMSDQLSIAEIEERFNQKTFINVFYRSKNGDWTINNARVRREVVSGDWNQSDLEYYLVKDDAWAVQGVRDGEIVEQLNRDPKGEFPR